MKFSCDRKDLIEALHFVIKAVADKPQNPSLAGIYLRAEDGTLELQSNNYSTGISVKISVNVEAPGEVLVPGKRFQEFADKMSGDFFTFSDEESNNILSIESGGAKLGLLMMDVGEFSKIKPPTDGNSFKIRSGMLKDLIRRTVFAVGKDDTRPIFKGCYFDIKGDKISVVATNTHRLALVKETLPEAFGEYSFIVPPESLRGIVNQLDSKDTENYVTINYSGRHLSFAFDKVLVTSRLVEGMFPPYEKVIPSSSSTQVSVNTEDFRKAVDFIALMSKGTEHNTIKFVFSDDTIEISSTSPEVGDAVQNVAAKIDGNDLEISFNGNYILDVLKVIRSEKVNIALNDRYSPAAFTEPGNDKYIYIATPVRTQ